MPSALWWLGRDTVDFQLVRAEGASEANARAVAANPPFGWSANDYPSDVPWGSYNLRNGQFQMDFCGPNFRQLASAFHPFLLRER